MSEQLHAGPHTYIVGGKEFKWCAKSCGEPAVFPTPDAGLVQIIRAGKTYSVTPPKLHDHWLSVHNVLLQQCIFPTDSTVHRSAGLPEGQGYLSCHGSLDTPNSVTITIVEENELAAVQVAKDAQADTSLAQLFYIKTAEVDGSASKRTRLPTTSCQRM